MSLPVAERLELDGLSKVLSTQTSDSSELDHFQMDFEFLSGCLEDVLYLIYPSFAFCKIRYRFVMESSRTKTSMWMNEFYK